LGIDRKFWLLFLNPEPLLWGITHKLSPFLIRNMEVQLANCIFVH
jgi:hypothetical protein